MKKEATPVKTLKLSQLVAKPQLIPFIIDDKETIAKHGAQFEFYSYDRQPMDIFMKLATATDGKASDIIEIVKDLILDEEGRPMLVDTGMLPSDLLMKAIATLTQKLGG